MKWAWREENEKIMQHFYEKISTRDLFGEVDFGEKKI
jgi:hypothetical protein